jgi:hypothetical protein
MYLIEEKRETELLTIVILHEIKIPEKIMFFFLQEKLLILLSGICDYLDRGNADALENALGKKNNFKTI